MSYNVSFNASLCFTAGQLHLREPPDFIGERATRDDVGFYRHRQKMIFKHIYFCFIAHARAASPYYYEPPHKAQQRESQAASKMKNDGFRMIIFG